MSIKNIQYEIGNVHVIINIHENKRTTNNQGYVKKNLGFGLYQDLVHKYFVTTLQ